MSNKKKSTKKKNNKAIKRLWILFGCIWAFVFLLFTFIMLGWLGFMPSFEELENPKTNLASEIISEDGYVLGKYYVENRSNVPIGQLPENLVQALIATEDVRYRDHSGIDARALLRAVGGMLTFSNKGGGSTITQQLAKNLFPRETDRTFIGVVFAKLKEWVVAVKLERNYSKDEILAMYLNTVDFGNMSHGIKSAAKTYFDKETQDLTATESALLVGMLKAPTKYNPRRNPENALKRRNTVLSQMNKYGFITDEEFETMKELPIDVSKFRLQDHRSGSATYFREYLRLELNKWAKENPKPDGTHWDIYKDGLKIYTTINYTMQKYAEEAVQEWIVGSLQPEFFKHWAGKKNAPFDRINEKETEQIMVRAMKNSSRYKELKEAGVSERKIREIFETPCRMWVYDAKGGEKDTLMSPWDSLRYMKSFLNCGFMAMDPTTGKVKAYVGGTNYEYFQYDHVTLAKRQVGSTFKPFVYTIAMQQGEYYPCSQIPNVPVTIEQPNLPPWTPKNSNDFKQGQMVTLSEALANSLNYISAYLMKRYGPSAIVQLVRQMGVTSDIPEVPAICLGTCELSLYEMVGAINTFNNKGVYIKPYFVTKICNSKGNILATFNTEQKEVMDELSAYKTVRLMEGVVLAGTAVRLRYRYKLDMPIAGKTGTTDDNSDGWFMGYTPAFTAGVWVGCEDRAARFRSTALGQGANMALPVWAIFAKKCYEDKSLNFSKQPFVAPENTDWDVNLFNCKEANANSIQETKHNFD
ncbi:MAG: PBP1A family penicillin-binding protein [Bacteroidales bacterium]|jgi:penicillin-binding protein 1A|nr:PBP1A family penicillin-binding protein [Bacteroidales bacterium]